MRAELRAAAVKEWLLLGGGCAVKITRGDLVIDSSRLSSTHMRA